MSNGKVRVYDAVGIDSESSKWFIRHVGMSLEEVDFAEGKPLQLRMVDMGPPLVGPSESKPKAIDVVGGAALSADDASIVNTFICEQINEYESLNAAPQKQYVVHPHFVNGDGVVSARRYSCAGFVYECYLDVGITLVELESLPMIDEKTLTLAYPLLPRILASPQLREMVGLTDESPWPVLLPGYLFHSLNRTPDEIRRAPYQTHPGDKCFPRREPGQSANADA
jgi:hypothetical protein